jgi:hypothetical protein
LSSVRSLQGLSQTLRQSLEIVECETL